MSEPASPFPPAVDLRLRITGPLLLALTGIMFFRLKMYLDLTEEEVIPQIFIALTIGYVGWEITRSTVLLIQRHWPGLQRMRHRLFLLIIALVVLSHFGYVMRRVAHIIADNEPWKWPSLLDYSGTMGVVIFYTTVILGIYEGGYLWKEWKKSMLEKEQLIQSQWQAKYDLLKSQINPHFLFNSLNSLSSLIVENPLQAEKFADEMSVVYRYLLRNNEADLVTLESELNFIRSYASLLTTRYGEGFHLEIEMPDPCPELLLPSLTLQLLVENAVKHNVVLKKQPLTVSISLNENQELCVTNNIQEKSISVSSNGVGLTNINNRFRLLNHKGITIQKKEDQFLVLVPLIKADPCFP